MLYKLEIENFYSVREPQTLDLRVAKSVPDYPERFAPLFPGSESRVPKIVALFGANGSGKTTILKALTFLAWFMRESFQHTGPGLPCEFFNDAACANLPIRLAVEFGGIMTLDAASRQPGNAVAADDFGVFRYELELLPENGGIRTVLHEALRLKRQGQGKWQRVFERKADRSLTGSKVFSLNGFTQIIDKIRPNASVVATLALFEHEASKVLSEAASHVVRNVLVDRIDPVDRDLFHYLAQAPFDVGAINQEISRIDLGIQQMRIEQTPSGPAAWFKHQGLEIDMPWSLESHGTRSFIRILPLIIAALMKGGLAIIDEMDISIHPLVLPEILRWFYDPGRNPSGAQLWMSCHSVSLLDDLTKEEVVLCEKDGRGRSRIYSLMDVGSVRRSDNLYKKYLGGAYGAIPHIG